MSGLDKPVWSETPPYRQKYDRRDIPARSGQGTPERHDRSPPSTRASPQFRTMLSSAGFPSRPAAQSRPASSPLQTKAAGGDQNLQEVRWKAAWTLWSESST